MCVSIPTRGQDGGGIGQESEDVQNRAEVGGGAESVRVADEVRNRARVGGCEESGKVADEVRNRAGSEDVQNRAKSRMMYEVGRGCGS